MLYHVPDVDRALAELARVLRPGGRLVAVTNSEHNLRELWDLCGGDDPRAHAFSTESAEPQLARRFARADRRDANGTVTFADWAAARRYVENSATRRELAGSLAPFEGPLVCRRLVSIFVAETAP
jgi:SAM-dependent methyltransferase